MKKGNEGEGEGTATGVGKGSIDGQLIGRNWVGQNRMGERMARG